MTDTAPGTTDGARPMAVLAPVSDSSRSRPSPLFSSTRTTPSASTPSPWRAKISSIAGK